MIREPYFCQLATVRIPTNPGPDLARSLGYPPTVTTVGIEKVVKLLFIAVCNNVGEAAFLGPNQKFENPLPRAS
jgi:hypothetical protein